MLPCQFGCFGFWLWVFYTANSETDEIYKICSVIGTPNHKTWADGVKLAASMSFPFPQVCLLIRLATFQARGQLHHKHWSTFLSGLHICQFIVCSSCLVQSHQVSRANMNIQMSRILVDFLLLYCHVYCWHYNGLWDFQWITYGTVRNAKMPCNIGKKCKLIWCLGNLHAFVL